MYCTQCGGLLPEEARFCPQCGTPAPADPVPEEPQVIPEQTEEPVDQPAPEEMPEEAGEAPAEAEEEIPQDDWVPYIPEEFFDEEPRDFDGEPQEPEEEAATDKKRLKGLYIGLGVAVVALIACIALFISTNLSNGAYRDAMNAAEAAMEAGDYNSALMYYQAALDEKADAVDPVLGMAKAYIHLGQYWDAEATLNSIVIPEGEEGYELQQQLLTFLVLPDSIFQVNADNFPTVTVSLETDRDFALTAQHFTLLEDGESVDDVDVVVTDNGIRFTYEAEESFVSEEPRTVTLAIEVEGLQNTMEGGYTTPYFEEACLSLVTTDVSEYPKVKVYFQITDANGNLLNGLNGSCFTIKERVEGGEFLAREVKSAFILEDNAGLNISLVADKSGSISSSDMSKIKSVMSDFVRQLNFSVGDRAEILAFDDIVQQMCYYTNDVNLLLNGIRNMSIGDTTAFYDAVYDGVTNSALQGGARCVVVFTDGMDNASQHSANEVVNYAISKQVPVYIIGVGGGLDTQLLRSMAQQTGGQYWHIDDLYDLEVIFNQVYDQQMQLYVVEYESDKSLDAYATRDLEVMLDGGSCRGKTSVTFTPVRSLTEEEKEEKEGNARYKIVEGVYSWEDADQKCREMGGHLATITSKSEMDTITKMLEKEDLKYCWLGGYTSYDEEGNVYGHWVTGEEFGYQAWTSTEPSRQDADGVPEWYVMLWYLPDYGGWSWNDQRNYPFPANTKLEKSACFICEYEW